jgi:hypothetical protein
MKPEELQDLLRFLLDEQKFFALKPAVGQAQPGIADAVSRGSERRDRRP